MKRLAVNPWSLSCLLLLLLSGAALADAQKIASPAAGPPPVASLDERPAQANPTPQNCGSPPTMTAGTETLVFIRHGEKTKEELGQLSCMGQNRALLLPETLVRKFGRPDQIYAPNPSVQIQSGLAAYSYVRPLATIEPTAIKLGLPVNTQIGYPSVCLLQKNLVTEANHSSKIFIAWEHVNINQFASNILNTYNVNQAVPQWGNDDYDRIYVFTIVTPTDGSNSTLTFTEDHEGLNGKLAPQCATAPPWPVVTKDLGR